MATFEHYSKPMFLYRYRALSRLAGPPVVNRLKRELEALTEGYIYCSTYPNMNDPMEGLYWATKRVEDRKDYDRTVARLADEKLGLGIASLAETWDHALMWAHYADGFRGICIAYSLSKLVAALPDDCALARVRYSESPHTINLRGLADRTRSRAVLSTKSVLWSYEREWRLFSPHAGKRDVLPGVVPRVYLGARISPADRDAVTEAAEGADIEVVATQVDGYSIERVDEEDEA